MMSGCWKRVRASDGATLVEVLIVLVLLAIVGAVVGSGVMTGLRADAQARDRISAFEDMQFTLERMSREIRAADPLLLADDDEIHVRVFRGGECLEFEYELDGADLMITQRRSTDGCDTFESDSTQLLISDLDAGPMFEYRNSVGDPASDLDETTFVRITFVRSLANQQPVTVSTVVGLRNA